MTKTVIAILEVDFDNEHIERCGLDGEMAWVAESGIYLSDYSTDERIVEQVEKLINEQ